MADSAGVGSPQPGDVAGLPALLVQIIRANAVVGRDVDLRGSRTSSADLATAGGAWVAIGIMGDSDIHNDEHTKAMGGQGGFPVVICSWCSHRAQELVVDGATCVAGSERGRGCFSWGAARS